MTVGCNYMITGRTLIMNRLWLIQENWRITWVQDHGQVPKMLQNAEIEEMLGERGGTESSEGGDPIYEVMGAGDAEENSFLTRLRQAWVQVMQGKYVEQLEPEQQLLIKDRVICCHFKRIKVALSNAEKKQH